jgi:VWFA-related protein
MRIITGRIVLLLFVLAVYGSRHSSASDDIVTRPPLYVSVERDGRPVPGLTTENFRVSIDGQPQSCEASRAESRVSIVVLAELSGSSTIYVVDTRAAVNAIASGAPDGHLYSLVTFGRETNLVVDFTKQKQRVASEFARLQKPFWEDVSTYDAIYEVMDRLQSVDGRKIVIFVGSGVDSYSRNGFGDVEDQLDSNSVTVYALAAGTADRTYERYDSGLEHLDALQVRSFLSMLASRSGGLTWFPVIQTAYRDAVRRIFEDISTQYKLTCKYFTPLDGKLHKVRVEAFQEIDGRTRNLKVRTRHGLRAAAPISDEK